MEPKLRRLMSFDDNTCHGYSAFDASDRYDAAEGELLKYGYGYMAHALGSNLGRLRQQGVLTTDLTFDVVDDRDVNAFATVKNGTDAILVHAGLVLSLASVSVRLANDPSLLDWPTLGATCAQSPLVIGQAGAETVTALRGDSPRAVLALTFWQWTMTFVAFHELGHLLHGHVDALLEHAHLSHREYEVDSTSMASLHGLAITEWREMRREQEAQADVIGASPFLLYVAYRDRLAISRVETMSPSRVAYVWATGAAALFSLFHLLAAEAGVTEEESIHPTPIERLFAGLLTANMLLDRDWFTDPQPIVTEDDEMSISMLKAWMAVDRTFGNIFGARYDQFYRREQRVIPLDFFRVSHIYKHHALWTGYDRVKQAGEVLGLSAPV